MVEATEVLTVTSRVPPHVTPEMMASVLEQIANVACVATERA
ncbi:MAG TPA: hypothetical protein RMH99_30570 [Sandaracinaceae bacterium LLY-WYZ-13_1]|nr:hypothetical protein [Sandaracinaceae bacterium LLY-WYZ-13_1]